ncbi:hypothetical protein CYMTET_26304 [Cymbomonas tetramitiformis]|uniref:GYF domain-containing protein n=1 Tax=Cymbomonas tetramitiformis TaxID=36881 RepID=A0AAE0FS36_9CHLO|nr:hypothetical protein CYMTET_26304 [Cymbomonas tetramitiformis]
MGMHGAEDHLREASWFYDYSQDPQGASQRVGPVPFASIFELFRLGIITPHTNVFCDGMKKKAPVQEIGGLLSLLAPSAQHSRPSSRQGSSSEPVSASHKKEASSQDPRRKSPDPGAGEHTLPAGTGLSRCRWLFQVKNDAQCGPVPFEELETMWVDGRLPPGTAVWAEGLKSLGAITIEQVPGLIGVPRGGHTAPATPEPSSHSHRPDEDPKLWGEDEESSPLSRASRLPPSGCAPLAGPDTAMLPLPTASAPGPGGGADCRIQQWLQQAHARSDTASHEGLEDTSGSHQRLLKVMRERDEAKELALVLKAMLMEAKATGEQASVSTAHMDAAHGTGTLVQRPLRPTGVNEAQLGEMARLGEEVRRLRADNEALWQRMDATADESMAAFALPTPPAPKSSTTGEGLHERGAFCDPTQCATWRMPRIDLTFD